MGNRKAVWVGNEFPVPQRPSLPPSSVISIPDDGSRDSLRNTENSFPIDKIDSPRRFHWNHHRGFKSYITNRPHKYLIYQLHRYL